MSMTTSDDRSLLDRFAHPIWALWAVAAAAGGYYLWVRHERHLIEVLPYLVLLACPLMHVFMHRGHGHPSSHEPGVRPPRRDERG